MHYRSSLINFSQRYHKYLFSAYSFSSYGHCSTPLIPSQRSRLISSTASISSWMDSVKGFFASKKVGTEDTPEPLTLTMFADVARKKRRVALFEQFIIVGRSSESTINDKDKYEKVEGIFRYLAGFDPTGESLQTSQKEEAAKYCNCTVAEVERALAYFTWGREAHKKLLKLKEEGKPVPKSFAEVKKLMGFTPQDLARSNLAKYGQLSRNAICPCGSRKIYKW